MAKFQINKAYPSADHRETLEAYQYLLTDGYFTFYGESKEQIFTVKAEKVISIERVSNES